MADEMTPVYCTNCPTGNDLATVAALSNSNNGMWNNPFIYLVWLMFAQRFGFGGGYGSGYGPSNGLVESTQTTLVTDKLNSLSSQMNNNQNTNLIMDAINGNHEALHTLSATLGVDYATLNGAINSVQNAITQVGGTVGMSAERVINSIILGNKDLTAALQSCCCENKMLGLQNTNAIQNQASAIAAQDQLQRSQIAAGTYSKIDDVRNTLLNGFSTIGYQNAQHTSEIIQANNANTQRIIDQLNTHWTAELSQELQNAKFEQSQLKQNVYLGGLINGTSSSGLW